MTNQEPRPGRLTGYIPGKLYEDLDHHGHPFESEEMPEEVKIIAEISSRILDLRDHDRRKPIRLFNQFIRLYRVSPSCLWLACEILASNRLGGKSLSQIAKEMEVTKQAIHQEQARDLEKLEEIMPSVADQMRRILGRSMRNTTTKPPEEPSKKKNV